QGRRAGKHWISLPQTVAVEEIIGPSAGLLDNQEAGERVPGVDVQFAIGIDASVSHIGKAERSGAGAPHLRAGPQKARDERNIGFARTACGPAGLDDRLRHRGHRAHRDGLSVAGRTATPPRRIELIRYGLIDHAKLDTVVPHEGDRDAEMRYAAREIRGAVDRVHDPHVAAEAAARFLAKE